MIEKVESPKIRKYEYRGRIRASYGSRELFGQLISAAFGFYVFFYYESVIQLPTVLAALAYIIYSIWNAINDPLVGWLMEKVHMPWEKKGYKRFPWMLIGVFPWLISFFFIFFVPADWISAVQANQWSIFLWYVISLCVYDTFLTLYDVNVISLFPDKFKDVDERRSVQGFGTILGIAGLVLAFTLPSLLFINQNQYAATNYTQAALFSVIVGCFVFLLVLPGVYEDKKVKQLYKQRKESGIIEHVEPFFTSSLRVIKDKTFMGKVLFFFGYQVGGVMIQTSALYISSYLLGMKSDAIIFLLGAMLLGALISTPLWTFFAHRINDNRKLSLAAGIILFVSFIPMIFINGLIPWMINLLFFGVGIGGHWYVDPPTMGDVLDDIAVRTGKSQQAIYYGFQAFFIKFGQAFIGITIGISHILTGFTGGDQPQTALAQFGIRIHSAIVPAILVIITLLIFWKFYKLTPEKIIENKAKLKEMNIR